MTRKLLLAPFLIAWSAHAAIFQMSQIDAEHKALENSNELKAYAATAAAAEQHADSQFASLYPRLTLDGSYQYNTHVPEVSLPFPGIPPIQFGAHDNYSVGPTLSYTLWDTGSVRDSYRGFDLTAQARMEDKRNAELQLLLSVRTAYLRLQLALEELRLLNSSLELSRAQNRDIESNYRAGAATKLDRVDSQRDVINYELQFEQKQAEVETDLKDLVALVQVPAPDNLARPGPPGIPGVDLALQVDTLDQSLAHAASWKFSPPDERQPSIRSQALQAAAAEHAAQSQKATLYPTLLASASAKIEYPDEINLNTIEQNTFMLSLSMPLFEANRTSHLVAENRQQAEAARFNERQTQINLQRDFEKAERQLQSLRQQQKLSILDVARSEDAARLYYQSYRGGKINLIDVQSANNRALTAKVNAARINAQMLSQIFNLKAISGEATDHGQRN